MTEQLAGRTIGLIGLGHMGTPMAGRLVDAGARLRAFDVASAARAAFASTVPGAEVVGSAAEAAHGAEAVLLILPDSNVVESVVTDNLADALEPDSVLVDMSSSEPPRTVILAETLAARERVLVDAPVSGGVAGAQAGTLAVMAGGPPEAVEAVRPVLEVLGRPRHVGRAGSGHALKALNNLMSAAHLVASSEAMLIGQRFGLDPQVMLEVVNGSSGRSGSTETKWPKHVLPGTFGSGFTLQLMVKDIHIALDLAKSTGVPAWHAAATVEMWDEAAAALPDGADHTEIARFLRGEH